MKIKRSERLVDMTQHLLANPHQLISLTYFSEKYDSAKSSISEDISIIKDTFTNRGIGVLETFAGATGGVRYIPSLDEAECKRIIGEIVEELDQSKRLLPGGYIYLSDMLGQPEWLEKIGRVIASKYMDKEVDAIMTVATKGVPIAQAVATYLNVPFVIVRRDSKVTEGSTVSINYVSGSSSQRVEKMELSRRSLERYSRVVIVDDFLKGGGTVNGMKSMIEEFDSELIGTTVLAENLYQGKRSVDNYTALIKVKSVSVEDRTIQVEAGNFLDS